MTDPNAANRAILIARLRPLVSYSFTVEPDDVFEIEGSFASGDDAADRETVRWIKAQLRAGNEWAWCRVVVTATFGGYRGIDSLGGCSYESEQNFRDCGEMATMEEEALHSLADGIIRSLGNVRKALRAVDLSPDAFLDA